MPRHGCQVCNAGSYMHGHLRLGQVLHAIQDFLKLHAVRRSRQLLGDNSAFSRIIFSTVKRPCTGEHITL